MKISSTEKVIVNNPIRRWFQEEVEIPSLIHLGGTPHLGRMLEVGSGSGYGVQMILNHFNATFVDALDVDADMVEKSRHRLAHEILEERAEVHELASDNLTLPSKDYEAAFFFGSLHHMINWQNALQQVDQVVKKGGKIYFMELYEPLITNRFFNFFVPHPQHNRFTHRDLKTSLEDMGWTILGEKNYLNCFGLIVGQKK